MEKEFEEYLGGVPRQAVKEFTKPQDKTQPDQLSDDDLMDAIAGVGYDIAHDYQQDKVDLFSPNVLNRENEFAEMFQELEEKSGNNNQVKK